MIENQNIGVSGWDVKAMKKFLFNQIKQIKLSHPNTIDFGDPCFIHSGFS
jgi:hypothetical protein